MSQRSQQTVNNCSPTMKKLFNDIKIEPFCLSSQEQLLYEAYYYIVNHQTYRNNQMQENYSQQASMRSENILGDSQIAQQSQNNSNSFLDSFTSSELQSITRKIDNRLKQLEYYKKVDDLQVVAYGKCKINYIYKIALLLLIVLGIVLAVISLVECWNNYRKNVEIQNNLFILICSLFVSFMSFLKYCEERDNHCRNCRRCKIIRDFREKQLIKNKLKQQQGKFK